MRAADLLIKCLEQEGVEYIFGVPGEENLDVMDALLDSDIKFIVTRHETSAAFMAGTYGRLTGKPGVCLATLGPGATNLLTGVANANMDFNPVIAITGQAGLNRQHKESHQYYNMEAVYEPVTKWNTQIKSPDIIPEAVRKAFHTATRERQGAVHLELPEDVAAMDVEAEPLPVLGHSDSSAEDEVIAKAVNMIEDARHPLILSGDGVTRGGAAHALRGFIDVLDLPAVQSFMGKGTVSWEDEHSLLTAGIGGKDYITCGFAKADLIIAVGFDMVEYPPERWNPDKRAQIIHVHTEEAETDAHYPVALNVIGNIESNLEKLAQAADRVTRDNNWVNDVRQEALDELKQFENDAHFPVKPQKIIHDLRSVLGPEDIAISDVGAHKMWMARMYHCYEPNTCLISNGLASMGVAVPGAIAAKLAHPERNVVAVVGDGAFGMSGAELETAVRLNVPIVVLLWRDGGYGLIEWKQLNDFGRASNIKFGNPDFIKLAEAYGFEGLQVTDSSKLKETLEQALALNKPVLIDCQVDYNENVKLTQKLGEILC
ncbi:acetolactate synthase large subunit [Planococcus lenghuensis]|uniref:Acetolactate synthase large subunit n=1 Tax=Planococcus lenghuensis TaxID=2213202 RepID=A0A1Q2L305_9BACL|nr:acetolactate synthase large subunit [Planococcus lenghuensis]AQQ54796.1 acetolactate synthase large subunit [Planococcus lenghuensis]